MTHGQQIVIGLFALWASILIGCEIYHKGYEHGYSTALESFSHRVCRTLEDDLTQPPTVDSLN